MRHAVLAVTIITSHALGQQIGGEVAPIDVQHWIRVQGLDPRGDFEPIGRLDDGRIYVFDFWATWCAPCIQALDKLSALQAQFRDRDVVVVGLTEESLPHTVRFLQQADRGSGRPQYDRAAFTLGSDPDGSVLEALIPPELRTIRPVAAIVDGSGRLAWFGVPRDDLAGIVEQVIDGSWDTAAFADTFTGQAAVQREKLRIMEQEDWATAAETFWEDAEFLTRIAFAIAFNYAGEIENTDQQVAERFARRAMELTGGRDAYSIHTLARVRFNQDDLDEALRLQRLAVRVREELAQTPQYADYYQQELARYEKAIADRDG